MKVIDKREEVKKEKTYSIGDWFEYEDGVVQLVSVAMYTVSFVASDGDTYNDVKVHNPFDITQSEFDELQPKVGKKVNVEIHIVSDAE